MTELDEVRALCQRWAEIEPLFKNLKREREAIKSALRGALGPGGFFRFADGTANVERGQPRFRVTDENLLDPALFRLQPDIELIRKSFEKDRIVPVGAALSFRRDVVSLRLGGGEPCLSTPVEEGESRKGTSA